MKKKIHFLFAFITLVSCSGSGENETQTTDSTGTLQDSVSVVDAFVEFTSYVNQLEKKIENVDSALAKYETLKVSFNQNQKDSSFFVLQDFMGSFDISEEEMGDWSEESQSKIEKKYSKAGFQVWWAEGYPYPVADIKFLEKKFKKDMSAELGDYVDVLKVTYAQTTSDAGLSIEWSELGNRMLVCEDFLNENPESVYSENVLRQYSELLNFMMWGLDNTPVTNVYDSEAVPAMDEMVAEEYQRLIKDNKHKTGKILADHLSWLESKGYRFEYEEVKYLSTEDIKSYLGL
ncbi:MAG: hypothetical protein JNJ99_05565 [Crocinitomicaceae bacterium]|nr:hypothetical protein [Crocinitomicaceae bacterium]